MSAMLTKQRYGPWVDQGPTSIDHAKVRMRVLAIPQAGMGACLHCALVFFPVPPALTDSPRPCHLARRLSPIDDAVTPRAGVCGRQLRPPQQNVPNLVLSFHPIDEDPEQPSTGQGMNRAWDKA